MHELCPGHRSRQAAGRGSLPREGSVEFTDERRTIVMPIRGALPVLGQGPRPGRPAPSVALLRRGCAAGPPAGRLGQVRAGPRGSALAGRRARRRRRAPHRRAGARPGLRRLRRGDRRGHGARPARRRGRHDAPHRPGALAPPRPDAVAPRRRRRAPRRRSATSSSSASPGIRARGRDDLPHLVSISFRVEADEEELVAGALRLVAAGARRRQRRPPRRRRRRCGPSAVRRPSHGFGERARTHAAIALRSAADAWPVLDRLLDLRVPDEITLDSDEILSLLDGGGVGAGRGRPSGHVAEVPRPRGHPARSSSVDAVARRHRARSPCRTASSGRRRCSASSGSSRCTARS